MKKYYIEARNLNQQRLLFSKYKGSREVFIETGSFEGDGIQAALDCGYKYIYSIEVQPHYYEHCQRRFNKHDNISVLLGDSGTLLEGILSQIEQPAVFWLDGHYSGGTTGSSGVESPLQQEINHIINHSIDNHVVMIDDIRDFKDSSRYDTITGKPIDFDVYNLADILNKNNNYSIDYDTKRIDNLKFIDDVMIIH